MNQKQHPLKILLHSLSSNYKKIDLYGCHLGDLNENRQVTFIGSILSFIFIGFSLYFIISQFISILSFDNALITQGFETTPFTQPIDGKFMNFTFFLQPINSNFDPSVDINQYFTFLIQYETYYMNLSNNSVSYNKTYTTLPIQNFDQTRRITYYNESIFIGSLDPVNNQIFSGNLIVRLFPCLQVSGNQCKSDDEIKQFVDQNEFYFITTIKQSVIDINQPINLFQGYRQSYQYQKIDSKHVNFMQLFVEMVDINTNKDILGISSAYQKERFVINLQAKTSSLNVVNLFSASNNQNFENKRSYCNIFIDSSIQIQQIYRNFKNFGYALSYLGGLIQSFSVPCFLISTFWAKKSLKQKLKKRYNVKLTKQSENRIDTETAIINLKDPNQNIVKDFQDVNNENQSSNSPFTNFGQKYNFKKFIVDNNNKLYENKQNDDIKIQVKDKDDGNSISQIINDPKILHPHPIIKNEQKKFIKLKTIKEVVVQVYKDVSDDKISEPNLNVFQNLLNPEFLYDEILLHKFMISFLFSQDETIIIQKMFQDFLQNKELDEGFTHCRIYQILKELEIRFKLLAHRRNLKKGSLQNQYHVIDSSQVKQSIMDQYEIYLKQKKNE